MRLLGPGLVVLALLVGGCVGHPALTARPADVRNIETLFPLIEDLGVDSYWVDDECRYFHYTRGSFSNDTEPDGSCRVWDFPDPVPFDAQANADMDRLMAAIRTAGSPVQYFYVHSDANRYVGPDSYFMISDCNSLIYDPGYTEVPTVDDSPDKEVAGPITPDWYEIAAC